MRRATALLVCLLASGAALAQESRSLSEYLPASTPAYMEAKNPTMAELKQLAYAKCLEDPRLKAVLKRIVGDKNSFTSFSSPLGPGGIEITTDMSEPTFAMTVKYVDGKGEHTFQVVNSFALAWVGLVKPTPQSRIPVDAVAALEVLPDSAKVLPVVKRIVAGIFLEIRGEREGDIDAELAKRFTDHQHRDVTYTAADLEWFKLFITPVGKLIVVTTTEARARDIIDRHAGNRRDSLAQDERFQSVIRKAGGTGTTTTVMMCRVDRAMDAIATVYPGVATGARMGLLQTGLSGLKGMSTVARVDGSGITSTTAIRVTGKRAGLARLFEPGKPAKLTGLKFAPKNSLYVNCGNLDLGALYDAASEAGGMPFAVATQQAFGEFFGLRLREDVLDLLGREATFIVSPNRGLIPDVGIIVECKDGKQLEQSILKMLAKVDWPSGTGVRTFKMAGADVHAVPLGHHKLLGFPLAPTFGVVDNHLLITPFPMSFQRYLNVKRGDLPDITQNRDFARLRERVPSDALGVSYLDLPRLIEILYETCIPLLQSLPYPGIRPPHYELPDSEVFTKHLFGRIAWRTADQEGMYLHSHSPVDLSGFLIGAAAGGTAVMTYFLAREEAVRPPPEIKGPRGDRRKAREAAMCESRVRQLKARITVYRRQHDGNNPESLEQLRTKFVKPQVFVVPGANEPYRYFGAKGKGSVLLHGYPNGLDQGICVLTTDLRMMRVNRQELKQLLGD